jgi:hypothetical protein
VVYLSLFKFNRGKEENLPTNMTDGYVYFCVDTGNIFIDYTGMGGQLLRKQINAASAATLYYEVDGSMVEFDPSTVALKDEVTRMIPMNQGETAANKILYVGSDGNVSPVSVSHIGDTLTWGNLVGRD